jgi:uncharacterized protein YutE (UPF0331/DUF86 family)
MNTRITDKIEEIEKYLNELKSIVPENIEEYERDIKSKAACERYFDKIMEATTDLAFLIIKQENFPIPEDDLGTFIALFEKEIIGKELAYKLREAKQMRNFIAHRYEFIDDLTVFNSISKELFSDVEDFLQAIKKLS